jgi:8-oxo-dGTP pyrophosphatase MutT (NUDIX family)
MYKVFFNGSTILFDSEMKKSLNNNIIKNLDFDDYIVVDEIINDVESNETPSDYFIQNGENNQMWNRFRNRFVEIPAAGGLVQNNDGKLLFIRRLGVWDLPKGKIEETETPEQAAVREVEEECGLSGLHIIKQLDSTFHIYRSPYHHFPENLVLKETKWFLMNYSGNEIPVPEVEENIEAIRWFSLDELDEVYAETYSSLTDFLEKSLASI